MTVSGRFSGRVDPHPKNDLLRHLAEPANRDDSLPRPVSPPAAVPDRITPSAADQIIDRLGDLDHSIVEVLSIVRYATGRQLRRLFWADTEAGRRLGRHHLAKLTHLRVVSRLELRRGGVRSGSDGFVYAIDVVGQRLIARDSGSVRRPRTPGTAFLAHTLVITDLYVELTAAAREGHLELIGFVGEPEAWRTYNVGARAVTLKPDAYAEWFDAEWHSNAFFEIDLGSEHPARLTAKSEQYVEYWRTGLEQQASDVFPQVIWLAADKRRTTTIAAAIELVAGTDWPSDLFRVTTLDAFAGDLRRTHDPIPEPPERR